MKRTLRTFNSLRFDDRFDEASHSQKADLLEYLILRASDEFVQCMDDIGNTNEEENRKQLSDMILNPREFLKNRGYNSNYERVA